MSWPEWLYYNVHWVIVDRTPSAEEHPHKLDTHSTWLPFDNVGVVRIVSCSRLNVEMDAKIYGSSSQSRQVTGSRECARLIPMPEAERPACSNIKARRKPNEPMLRHLWVYVQSNTLYCSWVSIFWSALSDCHSLRKRHISAIWEDIHQASVLRKGRIRTMICALIV